MLGDIIVTVGDKVISEFFKIVKEKIQWKKAFLQSGKLIDTPDFDPESDLTQQLQSIFEDDRLKKLSKQAPKISGYDFEDWIRTELDNVFQDYQDEKDERKKYINSFVEILNEQIKSNVPDKYQDIFLKQFREENKQGQEKIKKGQQEIKDQINQGFDGINQRFDKFQPPSSASPPPPPISKQIIQRLTPPPKKRRDFIGREGELAEYQQILSSSNLVLRGMGGIGKTALIKSLAQENGSNYKKIAWFDYQGTLQDTLLQEIPVTAENTEIVLAQRKAFLLGLDSSHLLLFDNVEDLSKSEMDFFNQLPSCVLITTRQKLNLASYQEQELEFLSEVQCKQLFLNQTHLKDQNEQALDEQEQQALSQIIKLTGFHTLTIELLGNIFSQVFEIKTIQNLLQELNEKGFNLKDDVDLYRQNHVFSGSFFEHMQKLFDISKIIDPEQRYILTNLCLLPSTPIEGAILKKWLGLENQNAIAKLIKTGWIQTQNKSITLHSVLAETLKLSLTPSFEDCKPLIQSLVQEIKYESYDINRYNPRFFLHCQAIAQYFSAQQIQQESLAFLYHNLALMYYAKADYSQAMAFYQKALVIAEKVLGKQHPSTVATYHNIAEGVSSTRRLFPSHGVAPESLRNQRKGVRERTSLNGDELQ